jgi:uncharacterized repeat protein (TIGR01451 family)
MAAPHVAGLAALLISAEPSLHGQVDALENLMTSSALPLTAPAGTTCGNLPPSAVPNNAYGWGRIQAFTAYQKLQHQLEIEKTASWEHPMAGSVITYTLTVTHTAFISPTSGVVITDTLPADTTFLSATQPYTLTNDMVTWSLGSLEAGESRSVSLAVQVSQAYTGTLITNAQYGARSDQAPPVSGPPVESVLFRYSIYLPWVRNE